MQGYNIMSYLATSGSKGHSLVPASELTHETPWDMMGPVFSQSHATTGLREDCINMIIFCFSVQLKHNKSSGDLHHSGEPVCQTGTSPAYRSSRVSQRGRSSAGRRSKICREHQQLRSTGEYLLR